MTVYAVAIGEPSIGIAAPFAVGLSLLVSVQAGGKFTGGALNPARALGPAIVFVCRCDQVWIYCLAELAGGALAGIASLPLYGRGKDFMKLTRIEKLTDLLDDHMDVTAILDSPAGSETGQGLQGCHPAPQHNVAPIAHQKHTAHTNQATQTGTQVGEPPV